MKGCEHTWVSTTADKYQRCSKCKAISRVTQGTRIQAVRTKKQHKGWYEGEKSMLDQTHAPDYVDYDKARTDLKNYWRE